MTLREKLAETLEAAYARRNEHPSRELSLVITKLEEAALWLIARGAIATTGEDEIVAALRRRSDA